MAFQRFGSQVGRILQTAPGVGGGGHLQASVLLTFRRGDLESAGVAPRAEGSLSGLPCGSRSPRCPCPTLPAGQPPSAMPVLEPHPGDRVRAAFSDELCTGTAEHGFGWNVLVPCARSQPVGSRGPALAWACTVSVTSCGLLSWTQGSAAPPVLSCDAVICYAKC